MLLSGHKASKMAEQSMSEHRHWINNNKRLHGRNSVLGLWRRDEDIDCVVKEHRSDSRPGAFRLAARHNWETCDLQTTQQRAGEREQTPTRCKNKSRDVSERAREWERVAPTRRRWRTDVGTAALAKCLSDAELLSGDISNYDDVVQRHNPNPCERHHCI